MNTCRFCKKTEFYGAELLKYGVRHYAHHACFLDNGHTLNELHDWQVGTFPYRVLKDRGLMEDAERRVKRNDGQPLVYPEID